MLNFFTRTSIRTISRHGVNMEPKLDELYKQGVEAFEKTDYKTAENIFAEILSINPHFADIQNKMGIIYSHTNRLQLAARAFERALELNPEYTEASLNLAITYSDLGQYEKARKIFELAAHFAKAGSVKTESATTIVDPFIKGKLSSEHLRLGNMYYQLSLLDEAIDEYQKALRLSPDFADIITQLGIAFRDKGLYDDAIREFNRAKECNSRYMPARLHLGIAYYSQGFYGLAEEEWQEALTLDPNNAAVRTYLNFVKPKET
jgi:tetratricopeptide (TPR) repeat protein